MKTVGMAEIDDGYPFYLCLTHDVDRVFKTFQGPYYAVKERDLRHLRHLADGSNPYWQFETIMELESNLGVRSSFNFLNEKRLVRDLSPRRWLSPRNWWLFTGRYDLDDQAIVDVIQELDAGGWEVGLHGSYDSYDNLERLRWEHERLENVLGKPVIGGRQHHLNLRQPMTWRHQREVGLRYDTTLGSSSTVGFDHGYAPLQPLDDGFTVFPLTVMERPLMRDATVEEAMAVGESLLEEAREHDAVMTLLWHQRVFDDRDFPGHCTVYRGLIERALELGAWVGPCGELYDHLSVELDALSVRRGVTAHGDITGVGDDAA